MACLVVAGSPHARAADSVPITVVASIHPWADLTRQVGGDHVSITTLLPAGASPHAFEPLPSQAVLLGTADLVIVNGVLDGWLDRVLDATAPRARRLVLVERVPFEPAEGGGHGHPVSDEAHDDGATANPHIWLDPTIAAAAVSVIAEELTALAPHLGAEFRANAEAVKADLLELDRELSVLLEPVRDDPFVPLHDAWPYFTRHFGLNHVATLEPFPGREPSARYVSETLVVLRRAGATVLFDERQLTGRTATVMSEAAGLDVVMLDPIGGEPGPATYQELLRHNVRLIVEAFADR